MDDTIHDFERRGTQHKTIRLSLSYLHGTAQVAVVCIHIGAKELILPRAEYDILKVWLDLRTSTAAIAWSAGLSTQL